MKLGVFGAVGARAVSIFTSFLLTIVVARTLGLEESGVYFLVFTALAAFATLGRFGTDNLALKIVGSSSPRITQAVLSLVKIAGGASFLSAALAVGMAFIWRGDIPGVGVFAIAAACSAVIPQAMAVLAGAVLRAKGHLAIGTFAELGSTPGLAAVFVLIGPWGAWGPLDSAILGLAIASWVTGVWSLSVMAVSMKKSKDLPLSVESHSAPNIRVHSLAAMMGTSLIFYVLTWIPVFILSGVGAFEAVSYYTTAARLIGFISLIPAIQVSYLAPRFAKLYQQGEIGELNRLAGQNAIVALGLSIPPAAILIFAPAFVLQQLYGPDFTRAASAVVLLAVGAVIAAGAGQVGQLMLLCDLERFALVITACLLGIWMTLGWYLAQTYGLVGVAGLSLATGSCYSLAAVVRLKQKKGIRSFAWRDRVAR